jgi:aldose 1-epimerase
MHRQSVDVAVVYVGLRSVSVFSVVAGGEGSTVQVSVETFGETEDGPVERYRLTNETDMEVCILTFGGIVQSIAVPDRDGRPGNVALGFSDLGQYLTVSPFFGCITGRYANRIANGRFEIDGKVCEVPVNAGPNCLHGGVRGFNRYIWAAEPIEEIDAVGVRLTRTSPDGEEGFPGTLEAVVSYQLTAENALRIDYEATTDKPTILTLTNHSYFNLAGEGTGSILDHEMTLHASKYTPTDAYGTPTGELADVEATPFDFRTPTAIGRRIRDDHPQIRNGKGYDHNFVIDGWTAEGTEPVLAARVVDRRTGRTMTVHTTEPGVQFYSANLLTGELVGPAGWAYRQSDGFCLETERFPDTPNHPEWPTAILRPGDTHRSTTIYTFATH